MAFIIPIQQKKEGILEKAYEIKEKLNKMAIRVKVDDTDKSPGYKFAEQEMRGIPVRIEIGPKDLKANQAVLVRRDTREKQIVSIDEIPQAITELLEKIQKDMLEQARAHRDAHTYEANIQFFFYFICLF